MSKEWIISEEDLGCDGAYLSYDEVVRCKDCVYAISDPYGMSCTTLCMDISDDHYCWWGERREDAD